MNYDYFLLVIGAFSTIFVICRIGLVLEHEFSDEEAFLRNPIAYAVNSAIDFNKFKANNWSGFEALWAAMRFRIFYKRFTLFISPREAKFVCFFMMFSFILLICIAQIEDVGPKGNSCIGVTVTFINSSWLFLIEYGRKLKKSVDKLRV